MPAGLRSSPSLFTGSSLPARWRNARLQATPFLPTFTGSADLTRRQSASARGRSNNCSCPVDDAKVGTVTSTRRLAFCIGAGQLWAKLPDAVRHAQNNATKAAYHRMPRPQPLSFPSRYAEYQIVVAWSSETGQPVTLISHFNFRVANGRRACRYYLRDGIHGRGPAIKCRGLIS